MQIKSLPKRIKSFLPGKSSYSPFAAGFTLIELLVVVMTMALLFGLGMARYRDFSRRKAVEKVGIQIRNDLLLIQQYALSGKKPDPSDDPNDWCKSPNFLNAYRFRTAGSNTYTYRIQAVCSGGTVDDKQVNLKNPGPRIQDVRRISNCLNPETAGGSNIGGNWFEFRTLAKGVNILNGMPVGDCLRIRITQGSTTYSIIIDSSGSIR